jgi:hypothetical protein
VIAANVESEKIEPGFLDMDNACLVLVEDQAPRRQPLTQPSLDLFRLFPTVAQGHKIVGLCGPADYADRGVTVLVGGGDRGRVVGIIPAL